MSGADPLKRGSGSRSGQGTVTHELENQQGNWLSTDTEVFIPWQGIPTCWIGWCRGDPKTRIWQGGVPWRSCIFDSSDRWMSNDSSDKLLAWKFPRFLIWRYLSIILITPYFLHTDHCMYHLGDFILRRTSVRLDPFAQDSKWNSSDLKSFWGEFRWEKDQ